MAYATQTDMEDVWGAQEVLTTFDRDASGVVDPTAIAEAIEQADAEIDSYISVAYTLPLTSTPKVLTTHSCNIAIYRGSGPTTTYTDEKRVRYKDAIAWLKMVAAGTASLGLADDPEPKDGGATYHTQTRLFTRTTMRGL